MAYQAGQKLGNYQLERFLGYGGFAEVYLGKHIYLNTQAAIKVLQKQLNTNALEMFLEEARIIAGLKHPHIVGVLEFGVEEQRPFLVMTYAPCGTLRGRYVRGKTLSPTIILPHIKQIADALHYAHERKIIHRDVKPENMLLNDDNTVLLSDFGLALRERSTYQSVHATDSAGTTIYMAPEQLRGKPCSASDQYSLGIVMYEWLCGCLPFDGPDISIVVQHLHEQPAPLREHAPALPVEVEAVVLRALEKDPKQRFASVQELATAFEEACKGIPVAENAFLSPMIDSSIYKDTSFSTEIEVLQQEHLREKPQLVPVVDEGIMPGGLLLPPYSSLQASSLPASLDISASRYFEDSSIAAQATVVEKDTFTTSSNKTRISRRTMVAGIAGIGMIVGGVGIWRFGSQQVGPLSLSLQSAQKSSGAGNSSTSSHRQVPGTNRTGGTPGAKGGASPSSPKGGNSNGKKGASNPVTTGKNGSTRVSTPAPSSNANVTTGDNGFPTATDTPPDTTGSISDATPIVTDTLNVPPPAALTVQINNSPSSVENNSTTNISVLTNMGNISFQFEADYFGVKNFFKQKSPDIINGTTDDTGNATVSWTPSLPPGQLFFHPYAVLHVNATDQNGNAASSQSVQVQITRS